MPKQEKCVKSSETGEKTFVLVPSDAHLLRMIAERNGLKMLAGDFTLLSEVACAIDDHFKKIVKA